MTATDLIDRLAAHKTLGAAPREELAWLADHGTLRRLDDGDVVSAKGQPVSGMFIVLSGHIAIYIDRGTGRHKLFEWRAGDVLGLLPYSRLVSPPADSIAMMPSEILVVPRENFSAMIAACHEVTGILVHTMLDRSRAFTSSGLQDEKMLSLGKLSAGLAHELNNPASAIERSAALLDDRLEDAERATRELAAAKLTDAQLAAIDNIRASCIRARQPGVLTPLQRAERESELDDWLADHDVDPDVATSLAETAIVIDDLDRLTKNVTGPPLAAALRWIAAGCSVRGIASEIQEAATRITSLIVAIKGFSHMDQASVAEPVDLESSLANTVRVLNAKARGKSIGVTVNIEPGLPRVRGFVGELNQIWSNLIDNALDAAPASGRVDVAAVRDRRGVAVSVIDNGPGIPPDVLDRIFDPFFTTKPIGEGTGLGLDIVRRLVRHNDAEIDVESVPGRTEFRVVLPLARS